MDRRDLLLGAAAVTASTVLCNHLTAKESLDKSRVPLGFDGHSMRAMKWKAPQCVDFAAEQKMDAVLINNLPYFESLETSYLQDIKNKADEHGMKIYMGAGSICENGSSFNDKYGNAETLLKKAIQAAITLDSPVVTVRIGNLKDRYLEGGIRPRMDASIKVLRSMKSRAIDAGIKFGFENHGGDLRSEEVLDIIHEVGTEVCGSMLDPGNSVWVMEDPMEQVQILGKHVVCTSIRDYMVWPTAEGATFQWTAIGEGLMDVPEYVKHLKTLAPGVPMFVESISNSSRPIPYLQNDWWKGFSDLPATSIVSFLNLCRRGKELSIDVPPEGMAKKEFEQNHQLNEFVKSITYLRQHGAGQKV